MPESKFSKFTQAICHRNFGVGADGVIFWVQKGDTFDLRIFNRDGGEAECSGNGLRCAAAYLMESGRWRQSQIQLRTISGVYAFNAKATNTKRTWASRSSNPKRFRLFPNNRWIG